MLKTSLKTNYHDNTDEDHSDFQTNLDTREQKKDSDIIDNEEVNLNGRKESKKIDFPKLDSKAVSLQSRSIRVPLNRYTSLKKDWEKIYTPIVENMNLQIRMNTKKRMVEIRTSQYTSEDNSLQKSYDFLHAYMMGFDVNEAIALLKLDDLYVESFDVTDVKRLQGDNLSRAIGRIAGTNGSTKYTIENATKVRLVIADTKIHILGTFENIQFARNAVCDLILGSPPGQVYNKLRIINSKMKEFN